MKNLAIFASGSGTNAENIAFYFKDKPEINVSCILTNKSDAYVIERAKKMNIPYFIFNRMQFMGSDFVLDYLFERQIDLIVLAGFLWLMPERIIKAFPNRIINIHPALLPKYGGKGMYGMNVHKAVCENKESETGISIHYVNEHYDEGKIIFQSAFKVLASDTPEDVAKKIHELEYEHFPKVVGDVVMAIGKD